MHSATAQPRPPFIAHHGGDRDACEALLLAHLGTVTKIQRLLSHRHGLLPQDAEDFGSWVLYRLIEKDYAIIRKFRGRSSFATYLAVVISTLLREYRVVQWGRWRSSAVARRLGTVAVRLEVLIRRDGLALAEAGELLRTSGVTALSNGALARLAVQFPRRVRPREVDGSEMSAIVPSTERSDEMVDSSERVVETAAVYRVLRAALMELDSEVRIIVRMHFVESMSVADIARALAIAPKQLYRRLERTRTLLKARLEQEGVSLDQIRHLTN
ncbi:MAG: sigma-70 family RNA polymerase sigma factor [Gemmatimonadaceae bacterium]